MAFDNFGISFMPGAEGENGQTANTEPLQEAVKLLNLRLPTVLGARSPVSPQLLQATGLEGQPDVAFIRKLLGIDTAPPVAPKPTGTGVVPGGSGPVTTRPDTIPGGSILPTPPQNTPHSRSHADELPTRGRQREDGGVPHRPPSRIPTPRIIVDDPFRGGAR